MTEEVRTLWFLKVYRIVIPRTTVTFLFTLLLPRSMVIPQTWQEARDPRRLLKFVSSLDYAKRKIFEGEGDPLDPSHPSDYRPVGVVVPVSVLDWTKSDRTRHRVLTPKVDRNETGHLISEVQVSVIWNVSYRIGRRDSHGSPSTYNYSLKELTKTQKTLVNRLE